MPTTQFGYSDDGPTIRLTSEGVSALVTFANGRDYEPEMKPV